MCTVLVQIMHNLHYCTNYRLQITVFKNMHIYIIFGYCTVVPGMYAITVLFIICTQHTHDILSHTYCKVHVCLDNSAYSSGVPNSPPLTVVRIFFNFSSILGLRTNPLFGAPPCLSTSHHSESYIIGNL